MSAAQEALVPLFVYGTLRRGCANSSVLAGCPGARFVREVMTAPAYTLVDLGDYPGLRPAGIQTVNGELWLVDAAALARLDEFEGHPTLFLRAKVRLADGSTAWAYFVGPSIGEAGRAVPGGTWG